MPRGKKKARPTPDSRPVSDDDNDTADNMSTVSVLSDDIGSITEEGVEVSDVDETTIRDKTTLISFDLTSCVEVSDVDETTTQDNLEDRLNECFDLTSIKSAKGRQDCLKDIQKAFCKKYLYEFIDGRKDTVTAALLFSLKKGKGEEVCLATKCASLLCLQMGVTADHAFSQLRPIMLTVMNDNSADLKCRGQCALSLAICSLASTNEIDEITSLMESLEGVFRGSYNNLAGTTPNPTPQVQEFHAIALSAWSLLLSVTPAYLTEKIVNRCLPKLPEILNSSHVDLRITAGDTIALMYELARERDEWCDLHHLIYCNSSHVDLRITAGDTIALMYELARERDEDFEMDDLELFKTLKVLATDCNKYRAKKDRRQQRSSFRDILRYIELGEINEAEVKFGREQIQIDSWVYKCQYNILCATLGTGMNLHLRENVLVRDIFSLGAPIPVEKVTRNKSTKLERTLHNAAMFKARTKTRNKQRDKRSFSAANGY